MINFDSDFIKFLDLIFLFIVEVRQRRRLALQEHLIGAMKVIVEFGAKNENQAD